MEKSIKLYVADGNFAEAGITVDVDDLCRIVTRRAGNRYACKRGALGRLHPEAAGDDQHQLAESAVQIDGAVFAEMLTFLDKLPNLTSALPPPSVGRRMV